jgi:carbon-monoxide dehydrogenase medium subunit
MIPPGFNYHAPSTVADALRLLGELEDAKVLAGGHSLLPMMKLRFAEPAHLVDLNRIPALRGIREEHGQIVIGAMTVESALIESSLLQLKVPLLVEAARLIAHGDPGNDHPALAIACDASFVLEGPAGRRAVKADAFFFGSYMTALEESEILCEIRIPAFAPRTGYAYEKLKRKTGDWATAGAAVVMRMSQGAVDAVRIGLTNLAPMALRAQAAEQALIGQPLSEAAIENAVREAVAICDPAEDLRGDRDYKLAMAGEMLRRALRKAATRCT